jgi:hypothetical protein
MVRETLTAHVERLEDTVSHLASLPARVGAVERELAEFRAEVRLEFAAVRGEMRAGDELLRYELRADMRSGHETLRAEIREGDEETRRYCACALRGPRRAHQDDERGNRRPSAAPLMRYRTNDLVGTGVRRTSRRQPTRRSRCSLTARRIAVVAVEQVDAPVQIADDVALEARIQLEANTRIPVQGVEREDLDVEIGRSAVKVNLVRFCPS